MAGVLWLIDLVYVDVTDLRVGGERRRAGRGDVVLVLGGGAW